MSVSATTIGEADKQLLSSITKLDPQILTKLEHYVSQLIKWQAKTNLIANATIDTVWSRHVADCAQLDAFHQDATRWIDLGSGGGLPGIVLAILRSQKKSCVFHLVESNQKKCSFLRSIARELELAVEIHCLRIESYTKQFSNLDLGNDADKTVVTARALASLDRLFELSEPLLVNAIALFQKGRDHAKEIEEARKRFEFEYKMHKSRIEPESVILQISHLKRRAD